MSYSFYKAVCQDVTSLCQSQGITGNMRVHLYCLILSCGLFLCSARRRKPPADTVQGLARERRLISDLLSDSKYRAYSRPTSQVNLRLELQQIVKLSWIDRTLQWDPKEYDGIKTVRIPNKHIWQSDVVLFNNAKDKWPDTRVPAVIDNDGRVMLFTQIHLHSICSLDLTKFPFDIQTCQLKFASWSYDGSSLDLNFDGNITEMDLSNYAINKEWELLEVSGRKNVVFYTCCPEPYPDLTFTLTLKRRNPTHYIYKLVVPSILLAMLIPVVFLLPAGSTEKTSLGVGIILGLILLSLMIEHMLPKNGSNLFTVLALYNLMCVKLTVISLACAAIVNGLWRQPGNFPKIIRKILNVMGYFVCACGSGYHPVSQEGMTDDDVIPTGGSPRQVSDWQLLSIIVDRLLLVAFIVLVVIVTLVMSDVTEIFYR